MTSQPATEETQVPIRSMEERQPVENGIGPDAAPRTRSSTFGLQYEENPDIQALQRTTSQQTSKTQSNGVSPVQIQPSTAQAGPSKARPTSQRQAPSTSAITSGTATSSAATSRSATSTSKSPFSTPITCPPRNRPNQILLINPTSTLPLTNLILNTLRPILPQSLEVTAYSAPHPAPTAIESTTDWILSSEPILRDLARHSTNNGETIQNFDGLLVASYSKHPLIDALRESYDVPVVGILEASLYVARMLGGRFGIISTSTRMKVQIADAVAAAGLAHYFVGVESLHINPLELLSTPFLTYFATAQTSGQESSSTPTTPATTPAVARSKEELHKRLATQSRALINKGADTIVLGSEFLCSTEAIRAVKDAVRESDGRRIVNVIDAVEAGVMMLNGLVSMGVPTSKKGVYRAEWEGRRGRGQTWL